MEILQYARHVFWVNLDLGYMIAYKVGGFSSMLKRPFYIKLSLIIAGIVTSYQIINILTTLSVRRIVVVLKKTSKCRKGRDSTKGFTTKCHIYRSWM